MVIIFHFTVRTNSEIYKNSDKTSVEIKNEKHLRKNEGVLKLSIY